MHKNYFTLRALAAHFSGHLSGRRFMEAYSHQAGELVLVFLGEDGMVDLRVVTGVQDGTLFLVPHANPPKRNLMRFFEPLAGATVSHVAMASADRTMIIHLGEKVRLHISMFGKGGGDVVQFAKDNTLVAGFKKERTTKQRTLTIPNAWESLMESDKIFSAALLHVAAPLGEALNKLIPALGKPIVEEVLLRCGLNQEDDPSAIGIDGMTKLYQAVAAVIEECCNAEQPRVYLDGGARFALIPLRKYAESPVVESRDVNDGVRRWIAEHGKSDGAQQERIRISKLLKSNREKLEQGIMHSQKDLESNKEDKFKKMGELLFAHLGEIPAGAETITIEGVAIPLEKALNAGQNASAYFDKAKHKKAAALITARRIENLKAALELAVASDEEFSSIHTRDELEAFVLKHHESLAVMEQAKPNAVREHPYRSYKLSEECEVFVGKNAKQNDELTFHYAKQNDIWFHVRGYEGSHAIMRWNRKDAPPKEFILKAAAIAAFHSKAKGSAYVPVIYTQRKFVHKPKGARPGSVVATREDVVMVTPMIPAVLAES